jgi:hypothetical protein
MKTIKCLKLLLLVVKVLEKLTYQQDISEINIMMRKKVLSVFNSYPKLYKLEIKILKLPSGIQLVNKDTNH